MKLDHEWLAQTSDLGRSGRGGGGHKICYIPFKTKVIHCSDAGSKWRLLCSLLNPMSKHLNRLRAILVYTLSGVEKMSDCWQLTQGRSILKRQCSSIVVGGGWACVMSICQESVNSLIQDSAINLWGFKKKALGGFLSWVVVPTHIYVQTPCKSEICIWCPV